MADDRPLIDLSVDCASISVCLTRPQVQNMLAMQGFLKQRALRDHRNQEAFLMFDLQFAAPFSTDLPQPMPWTATEVGGIVQRRRANAVSLVEVRCKGRLWSILLFFA